MDLNHQIGQRLLIAFNGKEKPSPEVITAFKKYYPGGITLFRRMNVGTPARLRQLTLSLQKLARDLELSPLLIAADQEGGQLMAVGDGTQLPGNMAIGATRSQELAYKAGEVLGRELAALGINVDYAPCADININPYNPVVGIRSFGDDPLLVGDLAAATIRGIQSQGVAAAVKHFPGHGDTASDSHHTLGVLPHSLDRLRAVELRPFISAIKADVKMMMTAHLAVPSIDGPDAPPATLSSNIISGLLRRELGYEGVVISDAMDMHAIRQGEALREDALRAIKAGVDLLLVTGDPLDQARVYESLLDAAQTGQLTTNEMGVSLARISRLKKWLSEQSPAPDISVLQCKNHRQIADEIAMRSITLVRDHSKMLPIHLDSDQKIAVVVPRPQDLTPADTSSYVTPKLAESIRTFHPRVDEVLIPYAPGEQDRVAISQQLNGYNLIIIGTINAYNQPDQAEFVRTVLRKAVPVIIIAMRLPYDLMAFPNASTFICTYSILEPSMRAVAGALFGHTEMTGRLPVAIPKSTG